LALIEPHRHLAQLVQQFDNGILHALPSRAGPIVGMPWQLRQAEDALATKDRQGLQSVAPGGCERGVSVDDDLVSEVCEPDPSVRS
jgi:hypothetical protein